MATELKDDRVNIEITPTSVRVDSANVLTKLLSAIKLRLDIVEVVCTRQVQTEYYDYEVAHRDGRRWEQVILVPVGIEASHSFNVVAFWKLSEFDLLRALREHMINMCRDGMTRCEVTWP